MIERVGLSYKDEKKAMKEKVVVEEKGTES